MKKAFGIIILIAIVGIGYWLVSPLFINKQAKDQTLSPDIEMALQKLKAETTGTNLADQTTGEDMDNLLSEMAKMTDESVEEAMPEGGPTILRTGTLKDVAHHGMGTIKLIDLGEGRGKIIRFEDFEVLNGPDLRVLVSKQSNVMNAGDLGEYLELGKLKGNIGTQNYIIPEDIHIEDYTSVVIYCKPFSVVFNSADLNEKRI